MANKLLAVAVVWGCFVALGAGCDDDPCETAAEKICARGCECGTNECAFGDGSTIFSLESRSDCELLFKFSCSESSGDIDWDACRSDVEAAQCSGEAFPIPESCGDDPL